MIFVLAGIGLMLNFIATEATSNCRMTLDGVDYLGPTNHTYKGIPCQRWDSQIPHSHNFNEDSDFPDATVGDAGNKCRNPQRDEKTLWCFIADNSTTADNTTNWDFCDVPPCPEVLSEPDPPLECRDTVDGSNYRGKLNKTFLGQTCQRWDQQTPNSHNYDPSDFLNESMSTAENYCRNFKDDEDTLWCYTTDNQTQWEFCDLPLCSAVNQTKNESPLECLQTQTGEDYRGTVNVTIDGVPCQRWDSLHPHYPYVDPSHFLRETISEQENYCRNPDGESTVWCYTTDPNETWEYCNVPLCPVNNGSNNTGMERSVWFKLSMATGTTQEIITQLDSPSSTWCAVMCLQDTTCHSFHFIENEEMCKLFNYIDDGHVTDLPGNTYFVKD